MSGQASLRRGVALVILAVLAVVPFFLGKGNVGAGSGSGNGSASGAA